MRNIVIATIKKWNLENALALKKKLKGKLEVHIIDTPAALTAAYLDKLAPEYVFFPHWSWLIPENIYSRHECVVFHMTDLPFGRGGSPLQNLIVRGLAATKVSALRVVRDLDAGPVYLKAPASLEGSAQEIYERVSGIVFGKLIPALLKSHKEPRPQKGNPVIFSRRKPEESRLPEFPDLDKAYDFIRMLDADGYPAAFIEAGGLRAEFRKAAREKDCVRAEVVFRLKEKK